MNRKERRKLEQLRKSHTVPKYWNGRYINKHDRNEIALFQELLIEKSKATNETLEEIYNRVYKK